MNECKRLRRSEQVMALNQADARGGSGYLTHPKDAYESLTQGSCFSSAER